MKKFSNFKKAEILMCFDRESHPLRVKNYDMPRSGTNKGTFFSQEFVILSLENFRKSYVPFREANLQNSDCGSLWNCFAPVENDHPWKKSDSQCAAELFNLITSVTKIMCRNTVNLHTILVTDIITYLQKSHLISSCSL